MEQAASQNPGFEGLVFNGFLCGSTGHNKISIEETA